MSIKSIQKEFKKVDTSVNKSVCQNEEEAENKNGATGDRDEEKGDNTFLGLPTGQGAFVNTSVEKIKLVKLEKLLNEMLKKISIDEHSNLKRGCSDRN